MMLKYHSTWHYVIVQLKVKLRDLYHCTFHLMTFIANQIGVVKIVL